MPHPTPPTTKHTPTPYSVVKYPVNGINKLMIIGDGENICKFDVAGAVEAHKEANAAFLVTAANSHDALIQLLKDIYETRTSSGERSYGYTCYINGLLCNRIEEALAAAPQTEVER